MSGHIWAKCPFYENESAEQQLCQDEFAEDSRMSLSTEHPRNIELYRDVYCYDEWQQCSIARLLMKKYEVNDNDKV